MTYVRGSGLCVEACKLSVVEFSVAVFVKTLEQTQHLVRWEPERITTQDHRRLVQCQVTVFIHVEFAECVFNELFSTT